MLAEEDSIFEKVSDALYLLSENREVAEQCLRMQEAAAERKHWEKIKEQLVDAEKTLAEKEKAIAEKDNAIAEKDNTIAEKDNTIAEKDNTIAEKDAELECLKAQLRKYQEQDWRD